MAWEHVTLDVTDQIATVTLNRPAARNAFAGTMREDLLDALQMAATCSRVIVITGAGGTFCSGGDVRIMAGATPEQVKSFIGKGKQIVQFIGGVSVPTLASIDGVAAGAGLGLALACDIRIASDAARLGATFSRVGLHPDWGVSYLLTRIAGPAVALDLLLTGRLIGADEALRLQLINRMVPAADLAERTRELAEELRNGPPIGTRLVKQALSLAERASFGEVLDFEEHAQMECFTSEDAREGLSAFLEKRRPEFKGR